MSVHVTVSTNPICINRSKVLLTDVELAKKNEWNRRRKLRLQQVRQQSRDLASNLRKKCDAEKKLNKQQECNESEQEFKLWQNKQLQKLQEIYDNSIAAVGTSHRTANCQVEEIESTKEKQELRAALAKTRGALAREKAKVYASQNKLVNDAVKSTSAQRECARAVTKSSQDGIDIGIKIRKSPIKNKTKPNRAAHKVQSPLKKSEHKSNTNGKFPTECTIPSPGVPEQRKQRGRIVGSRIKKSIIRQRSCSPSSKNNEDTKEVTVCASDDSDDSNATWPPRSSRVSKISISPRKVKFYNHDQRVSKEYMKSCRSVTHIDANHNDEMEKYIEEEEEAFVKKGELDTAVQKRSVTRGQKALKKERLEREFKSLSRQFSEIDKQQRIARIFEFPYPIESQEVRCSDKINYKLDAIPSTSQQHAVNTSTDIEDRSQKLKTKPMKPLENENIDQQLKKCFEVARDLCKKSGERRQKSLNEALITKNPFTLKNLIQDLEKERDLLLNSSVEQTPSKDLGKRNETSNNRNSLNSEERSEEQRQNALSVEVRSSPKKGRPSEKVSNEKEEESKNDSVTSNDITDKKKEKYPHPLEVNVIKRSICDCCDECNCQRATQRKCYTAVGDLAKSSFVGQKDESQTRQQHSTKIVQQKHLASKQSVIQQEHKQSVEKDVSSSQNEKGNNDPNEQTDSSSSNDEIKITVKVTEKNFNKITSNDGQHSQSNGESINNEDRQNHHIPWSGRLNERADNNNSSSSYYSPPSKLTPAQLSILNSVLLKMCLKNNNPELHKYVKRLLEMSKANIDNLAVSSSSEISVQSDIFSNVNFDHLTGTYYLDENKTKGSKKRGTKIEEIKKMKSVETKSRINSNEGNISRTKLMKKVIQMSSCSDESSNSEKNLKQDYKSVDSPPPCYTLADEYSLRLKDLIQMLNQASSRIRGSEWRANESSSYICPSPVRSPLSERLEVNSNVEDGQNLSAFDENHEEYVVKDEFIYRHENMVYPGTQENSSYMRNNITSLGLPFELLPKPFTFTENGTFSESRVKSKPPISSNKCRVEGYLPHELSAIPEVSSHIQKSRNVTNESNIPNIEDEYLSDIDLLDISSIKSTPIKNYRNKEKGNDIELEPGSVANGPGVASVTSNLSVLSHISNESFIDIRTDVSEKDENSFLESPSEYIEEVFRSLGVGWALPQLRKTRQSRQIDTSSTTTTSNERSDHVGERKKTRPLSKIKVNRTHSTPKKSNDSQNSSTGISEEIRRKFEALKSNRLSLTPPDLSLNLPVLGSLKNIGNNSDSSRSAH